MRLKQIAATFASTVTFALGSAAQGSGGDGLMIVAHGSSRGGWNERVVTMFSNVEWQGPKGVAFLSPRNSDESLQGVAKKLDGTGVKRIVIVPLLVSSFSDHYEEIRYYGRVRKDAPDHHEHEPLKTRAQILVTGAMDSDRILGRILADQVKASSSNPKNETVMLVGHGPNDDIDNERWLACLRVQAGYLQYALGLKRVDVATLRDDAPKEVKDVAVASIRDRVKKYSADSKVIVQPVLISSGHLQVEIANLMKDLECKVSPSGVSNHPLAPAWILQQATTELRVDSMLSQPVQTTQSR